MCACEHVCICVCAMALRTKLEGRHLFGVPSLPPPLCGFLVQNPGFPSEPSHWPWPLWHAGSLTVSSEPCGTHLTSNSDPILWCKGQMDCRHPAGSIPAAGSCAADSGKWEICSTDANAMGVWAIHSPMAGEGLSHSRAGGGHLDSQ